MNIPTDAIVMTMALIVGFIYFKMQKENMKPKESQLDEEEWLKTPHFNLYQLPHEWFFLFKALNALVD